MATRRRKTTEPRRIFEIDTNVDRRFRITRWATGEIVLRVIRNVTDEGEQVQDLFLDPSELEALCDLRAELIPRERKRRAAATKPAAEGVSVPRDYPIADA